ncbi:MAG: SDR family NAD(P)-dependent oxidoreductase [Thermoleophilaceae bacterium]
MSNAGVEVAKPLVEHTEEEYDRLMAINVKGVWLGTKLATPALAESGRGAIVNMASVAGIGGAPLLGVYCASKAAVIQLTRVAAVELRDSGIRVNAVCPSFVGGDMVARMVETFDDALPMSFDEAVAAKQARLGTAEEVAEMVGLPRLRRRGVRHRGPLRPGRRADRQRALSVGRARRQGRGGHRRRPWHRPCGSRGLRRRRGHGGGLRRRRRGRRGGSPTRSADEPAPRCAT